MSPSFFNPYLTYATKYFYLYLINKKIFAIITLINYLINSILEEI